METSPDHKELTEEQTRMREEGKHSSPAKRQPKDPGPRVLGHGDKHGAHSYHSSNFSDGSRC